MEYRYYRQFGSSHHVWYVLGELGAIHFHVTDMGENRDPRYSGGIEIHYRTPPDYMKGDAPSQTECWILHAPCWHDGSSLQAVDTWIPLWLSAPNDHDHMFRCLKAEYMERFYAETDDDSPAGPVAEGNGHAQPVSEGEA
jgi:hypothetical protein